MRLGPRERAITIYRAARFFFRVSPRAVESGSEADGSGFVTVVRGSRSSYAAMEQKSSVSVHASVKDTAEGIYLSVLNRALIDRLVRSIGYGYMHLYYVYLFLTCVFFHVFKCVI